MDRKDATTKKREVDRLLKWIIIPLIIIVIILMIIIKEWVTGGLVALVLLGFGYLVYYTPKFQKHLIGIPDNIFRGAGWGFGLFAFFFILMKNPFIKGLSIAVPTLPQSISEFSVEALALGVPISIGILVIIFPFAETFWKSSMLTLLMQSYGLSPFKAIIIIALIFGFVIHLLAYGVVLASAESLGVALEQIENISGLLFTASLFGGLATWVLWKTKNFIWVALAHGGINFTIVSTITLAVIQII